MTHIIHSLFYLRMIFFFFQYLAIRLTQAAKSAGATATLQVNPYYNKPTQEGMFQHFKAISDKGGLPIILYNIPSRSGVKLQPETVKRLYDACYPNIVGIKEATGKKISF